MGQVADVNSPLGASTPHNQGPGSSPGYSVSDPASVQHDPGKGSSPRVFTSHAGDLNEFWAP